MGDSFYAQNFKNVLLSYRAQMKPAQRSKTRIKKKFIKKVLYPFAREKAYGQWIGQTLIDPLTKTVLAEMTEENYNRWLKDYNSHRDSFHSDTYADEIARLIGTLRIKNLKTFEGMSDKEIKETLFTSSQDVFKFGKKEWMKQTEKVGPYAYTTDEKWWNKTQKAWEDENYNLLKSLPDEYIKKINDTMYRGVRNGETWTDLRDKIMGIDKSMSSTRAELIARDQIGKLNGQLTKYRQTELGIDMYTWQTANDERVRGRPGGQYPNASPSHWVMEGLLCRWDDPTVYSPDGGKTWKPRPADAPIVHPGEEIQCRCGAAAYFAPIIDEVDEEIAISNSLNLENPKDYDRYVRANYLSTATEMMEIPENNPLTAMMRYKVEDYAPINKKLRLGQKISGELEQRVEALKEYIRKTKIKEDIQLYRGIAVYPDSDLLKLQPGDIFKHKSFSSFSAGKEEALSFARTRVVEDKRAIFLELVAKKGDPIAPFMYQNNGELFTNYLETEFLGAPGMRFKVISSKIIEGDTEIPIQVLRVERVRVKK